MIKQDFGFRSIFNEGSVLLKLFSSCPCDGGPASFGLSSFVFVICNMFLLCPVHTDMHADLACCIPVNALLLPSAEDAVDGL